MGKGRDKRKDKRQDRRGQKALRTEQRAAAGEEKRARKAENSLSTDDVDVFVGHHRAKVQAASRDNVSIEDCTGPPSVRLNGTLSTNPANGDELILFGGEHWNGHTTRTYNELYVFNTKHNTWREVVADYSPPPRGAHQVACLQHHMFVFGGEYTPPSQGQFHHYRDLWSLDCRAWKWTEIRNRGPTPRSGHRMVGWRRSLVIFGGYSAVNPNADPTYFNDLWFIQDPLGDPQFEAAEVTPGSLSPSPRSGCGLVCHQDKLYVYGGYSHREGVEGSDALHGIPHSDLWVCGLKEGERQWTLLQVQGIAPSVRSGFTTVAVDSRRSVFFGGVWDCEEEEAADVGSAFYADMHAFHFESQRWFPMVVRGTKGGGGRRRKQVTGPAEEEGEEEEEVVITPCGRINALIAMADHHLYVYGGMHEVGAKEVALNDMYCIHVGRMDGWRKLFDTTAQADWTPEDESEEETDEDEDEKSTPSGGGAVEEGTRPEPGPSTGAAGSGGGAARDPVEEEGGRGAEDDQGEVEDVQGRIEALMADLRVMEERGTPVPAPMEGLVEFFERTEGYWMRQAKDILVEEVGEEGYESDEETRELLRVDGLVLAKQQFMTVRPILHRVEALLEPPRREDGEGSACAEGSSSA